MAHKIRLKISPNNETRITLFPVRRKSISLREKAAQFLGVPSSEVLPLGESQSPKSTLAPSLDIRSEFKTVCSAHGYKRTKFGTPAKTRIMRAAGAMDRSDPHPWNYIFLTATLPSDEEWAKWAIAEHSNWIINCAKSWLSKRLKARHEFYVWEMQSRGALHFHWCMHCPDREIRDRIQAEFRLEWFRLLAGVEKMTGISMWGRHRHLSDTAKYCLVQVKVETIKKSVAAYMAGYCGGKKDKHEKDVYIPYYPRRWYGVSRTLSTSIKAHTEDDELEFPNYRDALSAFEDLYKYFDEDSLYRKEWCHNVGTGKTGVHYHTREIQQQLWQSRKTMIYRQEKFPNASYFLRQLVLLSATYSRLKNESQKLREICFNQPLDCLTDSLYRQSLQRGSLNVIQVRAMENLYSVLSSQSSLPPTLKPLLWLATKCASIHSRVYPHLIYNRHGWLAIAADFPGTVDSLGDGNYSGTSPDEDGTKGHSRIASRTHVVSEAELCPSHLQTSQPVQLPLI